MIDESPLPSYEGDNLVNLVAELEIRLTGRSPTRGLRPDLADLIPHGRNYLLVVIDGLGDYQLAPLSARRLRQSRRAVLKAPFPTTTAVGLSSIATALAPLQHGVIGYTQWMPSVGRVVNMMQWAHTSGWGRIDTDPSGFLPSPNLWERLNAARVRAVIFHPRIFDRTPFSSMLYRGAELYGYSSPFEVRPSAYWDYRGATLLIVYVSSVDSNAHMSGQGSWGYSKALEDTGLLWKRLAARLPSDTVMVGTSDHGHCDIPPDGKMRLSKRLTEDMKCWGDGRVLMFTGPTTRVRQLADQTGARYVDAQQLREWLGGGDPHPQLVDFPAAALLAPPDTVILPHYLGTHLVGHHGGITPRELLIPLLVA
ncbi:MAG: alkaline phosphatase family protein [bacterium]|nr:alkaline phosphatase family protein [bacterium]